MKITTTNAPDATKSSECIITQSYEELYPFILNYIAYKINSRYEAEDLTQDVFVRVLDYKQMLREETVKSFLFTIARNIVTDYLRRHYKKQEVSANMFEFMEESVNDTESNLHAKELLRLESTKLQTFSPQRKMVYSLCRYEDFSVNEVSETLQISRRTVENHLLAGRKMMREYLRQCI
jgi:RNA polymerase sigma-70 factor (ECF subfamily)